MDDKELYKTIRLQLETASSNLDKLILKSWDKREINKLNMSLNCLKYYMNLLDQQKNNLEIIDNEIKVKLFHNINSDLHNFNIIFKQKLIPQKEQIINFQIKNSNYMTFLNDILKYKKSK